MTKVQSPSGKPDIEDNKNDVPGTSAGNQVQQTNQPGVLSASLAITPGEHDF